MQASCSDKGDWQGTVNGSHWLYRYVLGVSCISVVVTSAKGSDLMFSKIYVKLFSVECAIIL